MLHAVSSALRLVREPRALRARLLDPAFSWPCFSMVRDLRRQGVLPDCVLDVGANDGQFASACLHWFPECELHCFEPLPDSAARLARMAQRRARMHVHALALGGAPGTARMQVNALSYSSSLLPLAPAHRAAFPTAEPQTQISVTVDTLDRQMESVVLPAATLLKLDVQGFESEVLRGAAGTLARVSHVLLETSLRPLYTGELLFRDLLAHLEAAGFRFLRPMDWLRDPRSGEVLQMDALFARAGE